MAIAVVFILLIIGLASTVAQVLTGRFFPFIFGMLAFAVWVVSMIIIAPTYPLMIIVYTLISVINMIIAFVKAGKED